MDVTIYALLIWITAILIASLDLVIFIGSKNLSSRVFGILILITAIWVASQGFLVSTPNSSIADWLIRFQSALGIIIAIGFYHFSTIYPNDKKPNLWEIRLSLLLIVVFIYLFHFTSYLNTGVYEIGGNGRWAWTFGPLHLFFDVMFSFLWIVSLAKLYRTYKTSSGLLRSNLKNMFWALLVGIIPPTFANIILPRFGIYTYNWIGPISSAIWVFIIAYSIIRYRQMNVRAVITEVSAISMTAIFFIDIFINAPWGVWEDALTFLVFLILAIYLIRGTLREAKQRELLNDLNLHLSEKVAEQTKEIRAAYDLEKEARRELEKLNEAKNQFIMITQHHLRTPVTSIEWQTESLLDGEYGPISPKVKAALRESLTSTARLNRIIDDFLNITALKTGQNILNPSLRSLKPAIEQILRNLRSVIERKHITVTYPPDNAAWPELTIDFDKMRDILLIIVENAVTYNRDGGSITFSTKVADNRFILTIENTGLGITPEELGKIGSTLFYRGQDARKLNAVGMGVGLSVARAIIKAHHGTFEIESDGKDKGARVKIGLTI